MNLGALDLNLLRVLHALLEEGSVTGAARRVGLSQPATSNALRRLRTTLDDPLFVRSGGRMVPTPRAQALAVPVSTALAMLQDALDGTFDPSDGGHFRLVADDYVGVVVLPRLADLDGVELTVLPRGEPDREALLRRGEVDLALGYFAGRSDLHREALFTERFVCVVRDGHPVEALDLDAFCAHRHLIVSPAGGRRGVVDTALEAVGRTRTVSMAVPHFLSALHVVAASDLILTVPERIATAQPGLRVLEPPVALASWTVEMRWHARTDSAPAHRWLRKTIAALHG